MLEGTSEWQVERLGQAWQVRERLPVVLARTGEAGDYEEDDQVVLNAIGAQVLGDGVGLEEMGARLRAARWELYLSVAGAVCGGMAEAEAARRAGVDRMTVRRVLGKRPGRK